MLDRSAWALLLLLIIVLSLSHVYIVEQLVSSPMKNTNCTNICKGSSSNGVCLLSCNSTGKFV